MAISSRAVANYISKMNTTNGKSGPKNTDLSIPTENWVHFYHTGTTLIIPVDPESINDSMGASFAQNYPLSRSAPIYSYQNSGPRTVQVSFRVHRDLFRQFNPSYTGAVDPVDYLISHLDECVLPDYQSSGKIVNPPLVSMKIRNEIYIKGVVNGQVSTTYNLPIINYATSTNAENYKYAVVDLNFSISEVTPYSASIVGKYGAYRN